MMAKREKKPVHKVRMTEGKQAGTRMDSSASSRRRLPSGRRDGARLSLF